MPKRHIGLLTAGGDCQGLNAAIRAVVQAGVGRYGWEFTGFEDGFIGLAENRTQELTLDRVASILPLGGTMLGTGRGVSGAAESGPDAIAACIKNFHERKLDALVCLGGDGTQRFAALLSAEGLPVVTLPKTIDNDIRGTDTSFGFATATAIAVEAIDRLHTTASSHHRIMLVEVMGRDAGWLAAASGLAGGADIVLIPEIPYSVDRVIEVAQERRHRGRHYSMIVIAEGAYTQDEATQPGFRPRMHSAALRLVDELPARTGIDTRLVTLGYTMRGGAPCPVDRILATELGVNAVEFIENGRFGMMVAKCGAGVGAVPLDSVAGPPRVVPTDDPLLVTLRRIGVCMGD
ncbi:6-phosphofructokinase [Plasticicumulans acidivorans]|uniref:ATP-dependent 6-phosphofructokinase n=1 Tax=Plasticicumulans acidivorans TaxID=886464 RepID=A0A317MRI0_9GAMM|nr:ATP-dependent 6-phosphofructokinase [Plasticicumulans acidivorans]PWV58371.1 6-phosphofructokinase [Plasticicumulans acidivorans]